MANHSEIICISGLTRAYVALLDDLVLLVLPAGVVGREALPQDGVAVVDVVGVGPGRAEVLGLDDDHQERQTGIKEGCHVRQNNGWQCATVPCFNSMKEPRITG